MFEWQLSALAQGWARCLAARLACTAVLLGIWIGAAAAQVYPDRPISLVVGFPPGGSNDVVARMIGPKLGQLLRVPVVIENRPGANATLGTDYVARAAPDGYTLTLGSASPLAISPHTYRNIPYDTLRDFAPITTVAMTPEVVAVNPAIRAQNLREFAGMASSGDVTLASSGNGGLPHLAIELFRKLTSDKVTHVPYRGAGPAAVDVVSGQVQGIIVDLPALFPLIREGRLRALAVTSENRSPILPEVPTTAEQGMPRLVAVNWFAVMAPARTPAPIIERLHRALVEAATAPETREQFAAVGIEPMTMASPASFAAFLRTELERWGEVARDSGATAE